MTVHALDDDIRAAMDRVKDPCSIRANAPLGMVELGLVRDWSVSEGGNVTVTVMPTGPSCTLIGSIIRGLEESIGAVPGVRTVEVDVDSATVWTPDRMTAEGQHKLEERRAGTRTIAPVRPRQWQLELTEPAPDM